MHPLMEQHVCMYASSHMHACMHPLIEQHVVPKSTCSSFQINCHTSGLVSMLGYLYLVILQSP